MECIEARALKSSFLSEVTMKTHQQAFFEDIWCVAGINNGSSDDFSVDDLLDLSDKDFKTTSFQEYSEEDEEKDFQSVSSQDNDNNSNSSFCNFSSNNSSFASLSSGELPVPVDDIENLEWLSQIVDDSVSELSLLCPAGNFKEKNVKFPVRPAVQQFTGLGFFHPVPRKVRSKRFNSRPTGKAWSIASLSLLTDSSSTSSSSIDSSITSENRSGYTVIFDSLLLFGKPPVKKQKKNPLSETGSGSSGSQPQRRCSHCQVQKTPQWRTGPLGPKTLCNACGVRFKSGRLFPEYRPACSPTFSDDVHSNSHRKVLEMRRKKETSEMDEPGLNSSVSSFLNGSETGSVV